MLNRSQVVARLHSVRAEMWTTVELVAAQVEVAAFLRARRARATSERTYAEADA